MKEEKKILTEIVGEIEAEKKLIAEKELMPLVEKAIKGIKLNIDSLDINLIDTIMAQLEARKLKISKPQVPVTASEGCYVKPPLDAQTPAIVTDLMIGNNVYLYGKAGTGKTFLAKAIAKYELDDRPAYILNCSQWTSPIEIRGGETITGYKQGRLIEAWQNGGVLILDELPKLDPNTAGLLNEALAQTADEPRQCKIFSKHGKDIKIGDEVLIGKEGDNKNEVLTIGENTEEFIHIRKGKFVKVVKPNGTEIANVDNEENPGTYTIKNDSVVNILPTIQDGRGEKIPKHKDFCVIATGNTDMKTPSRNYSGNNVQDYSLVDRFVGSFYYIEENEVTERSETFSVPYRIAVILRNFINSRSDMMESISLRTMLNFSRTYQAEMLNKLESVNAIQNISRVKTLRESVMSFIVTLGEVAKNSLMKETNIMNVLDENVEKTMVLFLGEYWEMTGQGFNAKTGEVCDLKTALGDFTIEEYQTAKRNISQDIEEGK